MSNLPYDDDEFDPLRRKRGWYPSSPPSPSPTPMGGASGNGYAAAPAAGGQAWLKTAPPVSVGGAGIGFGGGPAFANQITSPDYAGLINNDPLYAQLKKDLAAQGVSDATARAAAIQRALIQFGQVPSFDGLSGLNQDWLNQDVNDTTRELAAKNTSAGLSIAARQKQAFDKQVRDIRNSLAARGALRSGETGHMLQEAQTGFDRTQYDTMQELLDFISGLQAGFAKSEKDRQGQLRGGATEASGRVADQYPQGAPVVGGPPRTGNLIRGQDPQALLELLGVGGRNAQAA